METLWTIIYAGRIHGDRNKTSVCCLSVGLPVCLAALEAHILKPAHQEASPDAATVRCGPFV